MLNSSVILNVAIPSTPTTETTFSDLSFHQDETPTPEPQKKHKKHKKLSRKEKKLAEVKKKFAVYFENKKELKR